MNLATVKRNLKDGKGFKIINHIREEYIGQIRIPTKTQTNGVYTVVKDNPEHKVSKGNNGKGSWLEFGKATDWKFYKDDCGIEHCEQYVYGQLCIDFTFDL